MQVFESSLENCDTFKFTYDAQSSLDLYSVAISLTFPASLREIFTPWCYASPDKHSETENVADGNLHGFLNLTQVIYKCNNTTSVQGQDHRILFTSEYWLSSNKSEVSGFFCEPKYSLTRRLVTNNTRYVGVQDRLHVGRTIAETLDMGIQPFNMTDKIVTSLGGEHTTEVLDIKWNVWYTMLNMTQPQTNFWSFRNTSLVIELSQRMWKGFAAYVIKHDYTFPSNETIRGTATSTKGRICVQELSLRLVEAHIALVLALIVALCFLRRGIFHRDPTSLGAHAIILARSPDLIKLLRGYGVASKQALRTSLSGYLVSFPQHLPPQSDAIALHQFQKHPVENAKSPTAESSDLREWWSPVSVRWWFRICLMAAIFAVVIALEVLLQVSDRENGLGDVSLDGYSKYTWSFLPTLVLVLVGLLFSMVDSTARTVHSFQLMRKGRATLEDTLHDPARQVSLTVVAHAVWKRQFALLWATFPALLAPIMTIVTGGLYTVASLPWTYDAELELEDYFRPENRTVELTNRVEGDTDEAWTIFSQTHFSNMTYPQWTYGEYALTGFGTGNLHGHGGNDTSLSITARVPATRVDLNCTLIGHYANGTYPTKKSASGWGPKWLAVDPRPLGCHPPPEWNRTAGQRELYLSLQNVRRIDNTRNTSRGYYLALLGDDYDTLVPHGNHHKLEPTTSISVCGDKRQHYFIGLGYGTGSLSVLHCVPYVEALWVTASFALPDLSLVTEVPLEPDRDSAVFLSDSASMSAFVWGYWGDLVLATVTGSLGEGHLAELSPDPHNDDTRRLIAALESTLAQYLALNLHLNYRQPLGENRLAYTSSSGQNLLTPDGQPATGTITDRTRLRLIQNTVSTRILQGLLGVMGACLVASTAMGRGARVIPRDPGSIASRMAYFADGEVWRRVPVGAGRWTDEQIKKHGLGMSGGKLLLDWWGDDREDSGDGTRGKKFAVDSVDRKEMS